MSKIEDQVQKWLTDLNLFKKKVQDDNTNFHFMINYPDGNAMDVIQPKGNDDMVVIGCATNVSPEHLSEMRQMSNKKKEALIWEFRFLLNSQGVDFQLQHPENVLQGFLVTEEIFEDGLTKDRLISSVKKVFRAKLMGVWKIQKEFGPGDSDKGTFSDSMYV